MDKELLEMLKRLESKIDDNTKMLETKIDNNTKMLETKIDENTKMLKTKIDGNTLVLRALEHSSEVNKAEHDSMIHDIANVKGEIVALRKDISTMEVVTASNYADIAKLKAVK